MQKYLVIYKVKPMPINWELIIEKQWSFFPIIILITGSLWKAWFQEAAGPGQGPLPSIYFITTLTQKKKNYCTVSHVYYIQTIFLGYERTKNPCRFSIFKIFCLSITVSSSALSILFSCFQVQKKPLQTRRLDFLSIIYVFIING